MHEAELIKSLKQKDPTALDEFLRIYKPFLVYIISPILTNSEDIDECIQDVLMKVWNNIATYREDYGNWRGWLTAIARNTAINKLRGTKQAEYFDDLSSEPVAKEPSPEDSVIMLERTLSLQKALRELSDSNKLLFFRKYYYMQSTEQIARETGLSVRAVEGRLYRIKQQLRKTLGGEFIE